jgi:predicted GIY-YIG superfamily endonuclease
MYILQWIFENTSYYPVLIDQEINHEKIEEEEERKRKSKRGYLLKNEKYLMHVLKDIPTRSGVYMFFDQDNKLAYIGRSSGVRDRVNAHVRCKTNTKDIARAFKKVAFVKCVHSEAIELEPILIKEFQPYGNISGVLS